MTPALAKPALDLVIAAPRDFCDGVGRAIRIVEPAIAQACDAVLAIGAPNSSSSVRLVEVAERVGARAMPIQHAEALDRRFLAGARTLGITAGASALDILARELVERLGERFALAEHETEARRGTVSFQVPRRLGVAA